MSFSVDPGNLLRVLVQHDSDDSKDSHDSARMGKGSTSNGATVSRSRSSPGHTNPTTPSGLQGMESATHLPCRQARCRVEEDRWPRRTYGTHLGEGREEEIFLEVVLARLGITGVQVERFNGKSNLNCDNFIEGGDIF